MGTKVGTGAISITDVKDGIQPIVMQLSNEAHAFVADQNGVVSPEELASFLCDVTLWIGDVEATYTDTVTLLTTGTPEAIALAKANTNKYNITLTSSLPSTWKPKKDANGKKCKVTMTEIPTGSLPAQKSAQIKVEVIASNSIGRIVTGELTISLFKGIQGVDGVAIRLEPSRLYFMADGTNALVTPQTDITIKPKIIGDVGNVLNVKLSKDGGAFYDYDGPTIFGKNAAGQTATDVDSDGFKDYTPEDKAPKDGYHDYIITITPEMFGNADIMTVFVKGSVNEHASDTLSIARIKKGSAGEAALSVFINSSANGTIFKNGQLDTHRKILSAEVYDMATGTEIVDGVDGYSISYNWMQDSLPVYIEPNVPTAQNKYRNVVNKVAYDVGKISPNLAIPANGKGISYIQVGAEDVEDGKSSQFTVTVTVDKA